MKFEMIKELDEEKFRRLTGVKRTTFNRMVGILEQAIKGRTTNKGGITAIENRKNKQRENLTCWPYSLS